MFLCISFRIGKLLLWELEVIWNIWMGRQENKLIFNFSAFSSMLWMVILSTWEKLASFSYILSFLCVFLQEKWSRHIYVPHRVSTEKVLLCYQVRVSTLTSDLWPVLAGDLFSLFWKWWLGCLRVRPFAKWGGSFSTTSTCSLFGK